jgi:hypothetical protein
MDPAALDSQELELFSEFRRTLRSRDLLALFSTSGGSVDSNKCYDATLNFLAGHSAYMQLPQPALPASALNDTRAQQLMSDLSEAARGSGDGDMKWISAAMAFALPLLEGALPKDERGVCVLPHHHAMARHEVRSGLCPCMPRVWHGYLFRPLERSPLGCSARKRSTLRRKFATGHLKQWQRKNQPCNVHAWSPRTALERQEPCV